MKSDVIKIASCCEQTLPLKESKLSNEYFYNSFPFCVIDAVFSIGVRYATTRNTVKRYCNYYNLKRLRDTENFSPPGQQHTISELIHNIECVKIPYFTENILCNKQRTSSVNGILKSEAVLLWAEIFRQYEIETLQDFNQKYSEQLENMLKKVAGQSSGISISYLRMLAGNNNLVKPDRHIIKFLCQCTGRSVDKKEAQVLLEQVVKALCVTYHNLNVRLLDHIIWKHMSSQD
ncbi:hypothetical protein ACS3UN_01935 [Oscillospiraceae bacterium LTW-04]|nr:hypothetical protein RBH76_08525 [Oscillospiraceae bacterium MB24-C1]